MLMKHMESHYVNNSSLMSKTMLVLRTLTITVTVSFWAPSGYHLFNLSVNFVTFHRFFATNTDKRAVCLGLFYWMTQLLSHFLTEQCGETFVVTKRIILRYRHFDYCWPGSYWHYLRIDNVLADLFRVWQTLSDIWDLIGLLTENV